MLNLIFHKTAWEDYLHWQRHDQKIVRRINRLLRDIARGGHEGLGKPEPLKHELSGWWSRRIDETNRLVYRVTEAGLEVAQCGTHYRE
jgi:toxin YoeB